MSSQVGGKLSVGGLSVQPVWFDSLGAKSSCTLIKTPDVAILVDPGAAEMQPSYPLAQRIKKELRQKAVAAIAADAEEADTVFISHYHYDHHLLPQEAPDLYAGKRLWIKDPNRWICRSQWGRARKFLAQLSGTSTAQAMRSELPKRAVKIPKDPLEDLPLARAKDYAGYEERKRELVRKGRLRFQQLVDFWSSNPTVSESKLAHVNVSFADGREVKIGLTTMRFTRPMFHGLEYTGLGWVIGLVVEYQGAKAVYTSDVQGPTIEDYAQWIIEENPWVLIVDGPPTYMFGFMVNRINLNRCIENMCRVIRSTSIQTIIYDHHLLRERKYKERTAKVWDVAREEGKRVVTAAEQLGREPLILKC